MGAGLSWFKLDCQLDDKFDLIEAEFGIKGFAVIVKLLQKIYGGEGYYCEWTNDVGLMFSKKINEGFELVSEIVSASIRRGIFSKELYDKYQILTSNGIQKRYLEAAARRQKLALEKRYLLIEVGQKYKNVDILSKNDNRIGKDDDSSEQRRGEDKREDKSREYERRGPALHASHDRTMDVVEYYRRITGRDVTPHRAELIDSYIKEGAEPELICALLDYAVESDVCNVWQYTEAALRGNLDRGIKTLAAYQAEQEKRRQEYEREKARKKEGLPKRSRFNNYTDSNKIDYDAISKQILDDLMEE